MHTQLPSPTVATVATCYGCELETYFTFNAVFMPLRWARHYHIKRLLFHYGLIEINGKGLLTLAQFSSRSFTVNGTPSCLMAGFVSTLGCNGVTRADMNTVQWWENRICMALQDLVCVFGGTGYLLLEMNVNNILWLCRLWPDNCLQQWRIVDSQSKSKLFINWNCLESQ